METKASMNREGKPLILAIKESQVSVAPEGKVTIYAAVINNGTENDQVALSIKGLPAEWVTIDSPTLYIAAGAIKQVLITVQPPPYPQSDVGEYKMEVQAVSKYDPWRTASVDCTVTVFAYESEGRIGVMLGSVQFSIMPNTSVTVPMILKNHGIKDDVFILSVEGIPANWVTTSSPLTKVDAGQSKQIQFNLHVPRTSQAQAGRTPFKIQITSQNYAVEKVEVGCVLTVAPFSQFSGTLEPESLQTDETGTLTVSNEGNTVDQYSLIFQSPNSELVFEKITQVPKTQAKPSAPNPELQTVYTEIVQAEYLRVPPGKTSSFQFRSRPRSREIIGNEKIYPYTATIQSSSKTMSELQGQVSSKGILPAWVVPVSVVAILVLCFLILVPGRGANEAASATQTAVFNQTQAAISGQQDTDGDGLANDYETANGLDPANPDTDGDGLKDGDEVNVYGTSPLAPDTDNDALKDGEEALQYKTNPLAPDTDGDLLNDGDEINRKTDPLNPDTDQDGLNDGAEAGLGTDPTKQDTDNDGLLDGQENQTCPQPTNPDTDGDGITDGRDPDVCDPNNPSLTAAAPTQVPTNAPIVPTPTTQPPVEQPTLPPIQQPTQPPVVQPSQPPLEQPTQPAIGQLPIEQVTQPSEAYPGPGSTPPNICGSVGAVGGLGVVGIMLGSKKRRRGL